jgi:Recombinase zinc beta ribbon domain
LHRLHAAKREVIIFDYVDEQEPLLAKMASRREAGYRALGYEVINANDLFLRETGHFTYITWDEFQRNRRVIANNATGKGSATVKGAVRRGELRCGHCGRKLHVSYSGKFGRYSCHGARTNHGTARCISISGLSIDTAVSTEVLRILKPLGIDAAVKAIEAQTSETSAAQRQLELSLQQARYEAAHARRQYDAVDPANRLVAGELERRWNEALQAVHRIEGEMCIGSQM